MFGHPEIEIMDTLGIDSTCRYLAMSWRDLFGHYHTKHPLPTHQWQKMAFLIAVCHALRGAYNKEGIRDWFFRKRAILNFKSPDDILSGNWKPEDPESQMVLSVAESLRDGNAT